MRQRRPSAAWKRTLMFFLCCFYFSLQAAYTEDQLAGECVCVSAGKSVCKCGCGCWFGIGNGMEIGAEVAKCQQNGINCICAGTLRPPLSALSPTAASALECGSVKAMTRKYVLHIFIGGIYMLCAWIIDKTNTLESSHMNTMIVTHRRRRGSLKQQMASHCFQQVEVIDALPVIE